MTPTQEYREIPLTQGQVTLVDADDYDWLNQWKWHAKWDKKMRSFYARRNVCRNGVFITINMHREILGLLKGDRRHGDHWDHDTLNNRRSNLRICTHAQNMKNQRKQLNGCALPKGVSHSGDGTYVARINVDGKRTWLGTRNTIEAAKALYDEAAVRLHGEFACLG